MKNNNTFTNIEGGASMESNFSFIKDKFPETYEYLFAAEKAVRTAQDQTKNIRLALESLVTEHSEAIGAKYLFEKYRKRLKKNHLTLELKIKLCRSEEILKSLKWDRGVILPNIGPQIGRITCTLINGQVNKMTAYDFLRRYGNSGSHVASDNEDIFIEITYKTSIKALSTFHVILKELCNDKSFSRQDSQEIMIQTSSVQFDENMMQIQSQEHLYVIDNYLAPPADAPMSKCQIEFKAHFDRSGSRGGTQYALIRQYDKNDVDEKDMTFLLRNVDTMQKTQDELVNSFLPCMITPIEISTFENLNSPFYIVAYHFQEEPHALSTELLEKLDVKTRLSICTELARGIAELHQMGIFQRLLSYVSVYVCDYSSRGQGWRPHLVKFDFAKLTSSGKGDDMATVKDQVEDAKRQISRESLRKYIPELDWKGELWEKVDVYSLGVLFCDILSGVLNKNYDAMIKSVKAMQKEQLISNNLFNCLGAMISRAALKRPTASEVQRVLETEMKK